MISRLHSIRATRPSKSPDACDRYVAGIDRHRSSGPRHSVNFQGLSAAELTSMLSPSEWAILDAMPPHDDSSFEFRV